MQKPGQIFKPPTRKLPGREAVLGADPLKTAERAKIPPFQVMQITNEVSKRVAAGKDVISLCAGEPSARPKAGSIAATGYTGPLGTQALREAIAGHYQNWYGVVVPASRIAVTTGSSGAFQLVFMAAFDAGDRVGIVAPGYPAYKNMLRALGITPVEIVVDDKTGYQPTPELLDAAVSEHGELAGLVIAAPANPTGSMLSREGYTAISQWCAKQRVRLISDEIYHGISYLDPADADWRGITALELNPEAIVINSFSKYWGMTGWRLGWVVLPEQLLETFTALASNFALSPPAPAQELALSAFSEQSYAERDAVVADFARSRQLILDAEATLGFGVAAPADGAFYYYVDLGEQLLSRFGSATEYAAALLDGAEVAVVPGTDFDPVNGWRTIRLSYAAGYDNVATALERIKQFNAGSGA